MSLYDVTLWQAGVQYRKNDTVYGGNDFPYFFYALIDHVSVGPLRTDVDNGLWDGAVYYQGTYLPRFYWLPSYNYPVQSAPKVKIAKFGDGYEQRSPDGINNNLITIDYVFLQRSSSESEAILHFLKQRAAVETFLHTPMPPYDKQKKFVCRTWDSTQVYIDNFTIRAKFEEVTV